MIQDRLTAKFRTAKQDVRPVAKPKPVAKTKPARGPIADTYTRGRRIAGSFWL